MQGSLTQSKYQAPQWYVTRDNRIEETVRRDKTLGLTVSLSSNHFEKYNLTPIVRYSHTKRTSNIWSREYERNRWDFLMNLRI
ncbi:MAG: surface lipoprotein assembly modifier [Betaproteobacteria bacterium]|nr:surface lipoprotein assembly modifier [Betaproteobacteria bacterium]